MITTIEDIKARHLHMYATERQVDDYGIITYCRPLTDRTGSRGFWVGYVLVRPPWSIAYYAFTSTGHCRTSDAAMRRTSALVNDAQRRGLFKSATTGIIAGA